MLQKFKITTCAFILCLFGLTLITVSPVLAEDSAAFVGCKQIKGDLKGKKNCFKRLARELEAAVNTAAKDLETLQAAADKAEADKDVLQAAVENYKRYKYADGTDFRYKGEEYKLPGLEHFKGEPIDMLPGLLEYNKEKRQRCERDLDYCTERVSNFIKENPTRPWRRLQSKHVCLSLGDSHCVWNRSISRGELQVGD